MHHISGNPPPKALLLELLPAFNFYLFLAVAAAAGLGRKHSSKSSSNKSASFAGFTFSPSPGVVAVLIPPCLELGDLEAPLVEECMAAYVRGGRPEHRIQNDWWCIDRRKHNSTKHPTAHHWPESCLHCLTAHALVNCQHLGE